MLDTLSRTRVSVPMAPCAGPASAAPVSQMEKSVLGGVESVATASELVARDRHWNRGTSGCEPALPARSPQGHLPKAALLPGFRPWPPSESPLPRSKRVLLDAWPCPAAIVPCTLAVRMTAGVRARGVLALPQVSDPRDRALLLGSFSGPMHQAPGSCWAGPLHGSGCPRRARLFQQGPQEVLVTSIPEKSQLLFPGQQISFSHCCCQCP